MRRGALQSPRSRVSTAGSSTTVVKPCARREAAASRAPSVEADGCAGGIGAADVAGVTVRVLIPLGAEPHPQINTQCARGGSRRRSSSPAPRRSADCPVFLRLVIAAAHHHLSVSPHALGRGARAQSATAQTTTGAVCRAVSGSCGHGAAPRPRVVARRDRQAGRPHAQRTRRRKQHPSPPRRTARWGVTLLVDGRYQEGTTGRDVYESQEVH